MTLNVAHGRGTGFHQLLQHPDETRENLDNIATLLKDTAPDIIALQEADGPSFWSGNFNHVEYLGSRSEFSHSVQASHVDGMGLSYGTALMSRLDLSNPQAVTFDPSLSPVPKGFVVSTINWPGNKDIDIDVISVHLDFMSKSIRGKQAKELVKVLRARNNHVIVMGDLNTEWQQQDSAAKYLAEKLGLTAFQPESTGLATFPFSRSDRNRDFRSSRCGCRNHSVQPATCKSRAVVLYRKARVPYLLAAGNINRLFLAGNYSADFHGNGENGTQGNTWHLFLPVGNRASGLQ